MQLLKKECIVNRLKQLMSLILVEKNTSKKKQININENKGEITSITGLATTAVLNGAKKNIRNLV